MTRSLWIAAFCLLGFCPGARGEEQTYRTRHVLVTYSGVDEKYAIAVARVTQAARNQAADAHGYDMPEIISITLDCKSENQPQLYTDGTDHFTLLVRTEEDLAPPAKSGIFHLYGLCHEVSHLAMYRLMPKHEWLSFGAAEGWAHYLGSRLVDQVWEQEGNTLWPIAYDYRADGTQRLERQLRAAHPDAITVGAGAWKELAALVGEKQMPAVFKAWGAASVDPFDPAPGAQAALLQFNGQEKVRAWWDKHNEQLISKQPRSDFPVQTLAKTQLTGKPEPLALDDGQEAGKRSFSGGGHAVVFESPDENSYLTTVRIFGNRYGTPTAPKEDFHIWLCDSEGKVIRDFSFAYALFARGNPRWVDLPVEPTRTPKKFMIVAAFDPSATKGVFVYHDAAMDADSREGMPGRLSKFDKGDWMMRAVLDKAK